MASVQTTKAISKEAIEGYVVIDTPSVSNTDASQDKTHWFVDRAAAHSESAIRAVATVRNVVMTACTDATNAAFDRAAAKAAYGEAMEKATQIRDTVVAAYDEAAKRALEHIVAMTL